MENKTPSQNIQDVYLNTVRRDKAPVTVFLISGVKLIGKIKGFDKYSVILEANNQEQLIFKHAISTVTTAKMSMAPPPPPPIPHPADTTTTEKYTTTTEK
jgi:host factor-I protein